MERIHIVTVEYTMPDRVWDESVRTYPEHHRARLMMLTSHPETQVHIRNVQGTSGGIDHASPIVIHDLHEQARDGHRTIVERIRG